MLVRNETDARISLYRATDVLVTATSICAVDTVGLPTASLYIANFCTAAVTYIIKGSYSKDETNTAYWYPIASGTAAVGSVTCLGAFGGAGCISALGNHNRSLNVELAATVVTSGILVMQMMTW